MPGCSSVNRVPSTGPIARRRARDRAARFAAPDPSHVPRAASRDVSFGPCNSSCTARALVHCGVALETSASAASSIEGAGVPSTATTMSPGSAPVAAIGGHDDGRAFSTQSITNGGVNCSSASGAEITRACPSCSAATIRRRVATNSRSSWSVAASCSVVDSADAPRGLDDVEVRIGVLEHVPRQHDRGQTGSAVVHREAAARQLWRAGIGRRACARQRAVSSAATDNGMRTDTPAPISAVNSAPAAAPPVARCDRRSARAQAEAKMAPYQLPRWCPPGVQRPLEELSRKESR